MGGGTHSYPIVFQVGHLAGVVWDMCERTGCTVVLDMGSGLVSREMDTDVLHTILSALFLYRPSHCPVVNHFPLPPSTSGIYCTRSEIGRWEGLGTLLIRYDGGKAWEHC